MTRLFLFVGGASEPVVRTGTDDIASALGAHGVDYARWSVAELPAEAGVPEVLARHGADVERISATFGYHSVDVVRMTLDHPQAAAARQKFLSEHVHAEDEARFFADGTGTFYLHFADHGVVAALVCTAGDFVRVPAGTKHWFDMGTRPRFAAIRWFTTPEGWVATFTGSPVSADYPTHDELS